MKTPKPPGPYKPSRRYRAKKKLSKILKLREPWHTTRDHPGKYEPGTWRWIIFDRFTSVHWADPGSQGIPDNSGWQWIKGNYGGKILRYKDKKPESGDISHYSLMSWDMIFMTKFARTSKLWRKLTIKHNWTCGCSHRIWSRKQAYGVMGNCPMHGFRARFPHIP